MCGDQRTTFGSKVSLSKLWAPEWDSGHLYRANAFTLALYFLLEIVLNFERKVTKRQTSRSQPLG